MGVEYIDRRIVPGGEAADRSTKWKKVIPVLVFGFCVGQCKARTGTLPLPP